MILVRFIALMLTFIGILAACAVVVILGVVMLRFLPALITVILAFSIFGWLLNKVAVRIDTNANS
jgi:ABC-type dipeptide/oligopeptide/nickel transport system permease subunit